MLRAILWAKAHISYLQSGRPDPREGSLQSQRRKVYEIGRNRLAAHRRWRAERYRQNSLSDLGRPDQGLPLQHSDRLREHLLGLQSRRQRSHVSTRNDEHI
jgi:hypothetical protein